MDVVALLGDGQLAFGAVTYAGASYSSLTKIAKKITGAHWSGPQFFGLLAAGTARQAKGAG